MKDFPETKLLECADPSPNPKGPTYPSFGLYTEDELPITAKLQDFAWLLGRNLTRMSTGERETNDEGDNNAEGDALSHNPIPVWSGFNSLLHQTLPATRVGCPPLLAAPAHKSNTLLTILMHAQAINVKVMGPGHKTIISLDLGLYQPAKKLQVARNDLVHIILCPGELHIVMAQLRSIGSFIEGSGIDLCWIESDLYGPTTVKQILEGKHVKRGEAAHMVTLQALFILYQKAFMAQQTSTDGKAN